MVAQASLKLCIALIHNNDKQRYEYIRPWLDQLKRQLSSNFNVEIFEISKQLEIVPNKISLTFLRKFLLWKLNREWRKYILLKPKNIIFDTMILIRQVLLVYINRKRENWRSVIDTVVTDKHIRAWSQFLEKEGDFLICFEDDAVFKTTSISNLKKSLLEINKYKNKPLYLNFAGGCSPEELNFTNLELKNDKTRMYYRKPVTNTGCCTLITRLTAELLFQNLLKRPWLRLIPFDWLLNKIFILTASKYDYFCYHAYPHIVSHGSVTGKYASWLGSRDHTN